MIFLLRMFTPYMGPHPFQGSIQENVIILKANVTFTLRSREVKHLILPNMWSDVENELRNVQNLNSTLLLRVVHSAAALIRILTAPLSLADGTNPRRLCHAAIWSWGWCLHLVGQLLAHQEAKSQLPWICFPLDHIHVLVKGFCTVTKLTNLGRRASKVRQWPGKTSLWKRNRDEISIISREPSSAFDQLGCKRIQKKNLSRLRSSRLN